MLNLLYFTGWLRQTHPTFLESFDDVPNPSDNAKLVVKRGKGRERDEAPPNPQIRHHPFAKDMEEEIRYVTNLLRAGSFEEVDEFANELRELGWSQEKIYSIMTQASFNAKLFRRRSGKTLPAEGPAERAQAKWSA